MLERIQAYIKTATLGYALMTVMDEDDLGRGPRMAQQLVNLRDIDNNFMRVFIEGVEEHGLQNRLMENAMDIGIFKADINPASLKPAKTGIYTNRVEWQETTSQSSCVLYNGNHWFTYMRYHLDIRAAYNQREKAKEELAKNPSTGDMIMGLKTVIADAETVIVRDGVWLVRFLDLGKSQA